MNWMHACRRGVTTTTTIAGLVSVAACGNGVDLAGSTANQMRLSFTTRPASASLRATIGVARDIAIGPSGQLVLKKIQLVIDRVELSRSGAVSCTDDAEGSGGSDDCEEVEGNAILVNVPVDDALHTVISVPVASGTYRSLDAKVAPVDAATAATLGVPSDMSGKSVRVEGTFNGAPFVFTSPLRAGLEFAFDPPLVVDGTSKNATVNIDVRKWFLTSDGSLIDPATANAGGANAELVESNIRNSFEAFEDDDMKGDDDHQGDHQSGDH
jgi:hypothetical protein